MYLKAGTISCKTIGTVLSKLVISHLATLRLSSSLPAGAKLLLSLQLGGDSEQMHRKSVIT